MYEEYSKQAVSSKRYRELLGTALYVFNSNNSFIIENILANDAPGEHNWHDLIDLTSGPLKKPIKNTITKNFDTTIENSFSDLVDVRNRIMHSFPVTAPSGISDDVDNQVLATKDKKSGTQSYITEKLLLDFIKENEVLSRALHNLRGH